jgi:hypothetical protein
MNARQILAAGVSVMLVLLALTVYQSCTLTAKVPGQAVSALSTNYQWTLHRAAALLRQWGGDQVAVSIQSDSLGVKPIGELALARVRVRSIVDYSDATFGSTKRIIAHEAFDVKLGWDINSDIAIVVSRESHTVHISANRPRVLSVTHADREPQILLSEDGVLNKLKPEDMVKVQAQLEAGARGSDEVHEGMATAIEDFKRYFTALFQMEGYTVVFDFDGTNRLNAPLLSPKTEVSQ